ncbi:methylated-DNA-[protein]-cysteine S-methyltransferase/methylated-DNA-[protein]-cysteine S-methyltransferase [Thermosporothrix hazakensis]|jgi:O-6-methylguanine DNA methyltransferase|uniref:Methylated-DNA--protein-cysteine methyltransferase n=2 Tax=Thermosporothrix TaxID=768650 RepID=A0A326UUD8_THEHA|nr:methylated-DNA--[protein]-cysteine S-methyltransferase [Thermosporothrix hazakensis]PZW36233.1 methylated-DNA-[protein]-cysteine S-methyltransferase/methylated-DNA-[protein]-cysteine S-methyltransferase [Thermosporothrix hazakensis]BBH88696.1 hypothetical protein KTC_34470 [Thermosporothrix sp. COM3]GCE46882.1 hypothetical protein KTH_17510 [Thermosporothrix hazakensis]
MEKARLIYHASVATPKGECVVMATEHGVCWTGTPGTPLEEGLAWCRKRIPQAQIEAGIGVAPLQQAIDELQRYIQGEKVQFSCPLDLYGTPFQKLVWQELYKIPYGETRSYAMIARAIGRPQACRAVGAANGANPVAVIVPCHRVIGSSGSLVGYGGGLETKVWLLALERAGMTPLL